MAELELYLADGTPSGVITAELGISSVRAAVASRTALPELIRREEAARTGIYLLVGADPDLPGRQLVYVGEGDQVKTRLAAHDADEAKEFFTRAVLIVSKDENLTKAHGRYLESRIIAAIRGAGRAKLVNGTEPPFKGYRSRKSLTWRGCWMRSRSYYQFWALTFCGQRGMRWARRPERKKARRSVIGDMPRRCVFVFKEWHRCESEGGQ